MKAIPKKNGKESSNMVSWQEMDPIFANFTSELQEFWENYDFDWQETKEWLSIGLKDYESGFASYLKSSGYVSHLPFALGVLENLRTEYDQILVQFAGNQEVNLSFIEIPAFETVVNWTDIHKDFAKRLYSGKTYQQLWEETGLTYQDAKKWISVGAEIDDHGFVAWLRNVKRLGPEWITIYKEDYKILSGKFKKYGLCSECNQPNTGEQWCQPCNSRHLQKEDFANWTSGNQKVDEFIQKYQLEATDADKFLEWIPYKQFTNIEYLTEGVFGKVYRARWTIGNINFWSFRKKQWNREKYREVVLKSLSNSKDNTDFLDETANHKIIDDWFNNIVSCYGISRDPEGNYLMVMKYMPEGNLRSYLRKNNKNLSLKDKFNQLVSISQGLKDIHQKNLVHRDFHSGNILKGMEQTACLITDLGLCKPANETSQEKVFGVMPYVAPEVLQGHPYTQASDIYSFGIVAYEVLSGLSPYYDRLHDAHLGVEICQGLRPQFRIKIPQLLEDLIKRCWDADPAKRSTAHELEKVLRSWNNSYEFKNQLQASKKHNQTVPDNIKFPSYQIHHGAVYNSKLLPTKEITQLMHDFNFQFQTKALELNTQLIKVKELAKEITVEQKHNDLKKALKLILQKSDELETIITTNQLAISDEMKETLAKIKELKHKSQEKDSNYQQLAKKKHAKENELKELKKIIIANNHLEDEDDLGEISELLEAQVDFLKNNNSERLKRSEKRIIKMKIITGVEINQLCQLQMEIAHLELELNNNINQSTKQLTQIINNITNINAPLTVQHGHALIGNTFGNQTQITYSNNKRSREESEENNTKRINLDWTNIHPSFSNQNLINHWLNNNFTYEQTQEWINIGLTPQDSNFCTWLRDNKHLTAEECLNYHHLNQLKTEHQTQQQQASIQLPPKS